MNDIIEKLSMGGYGFYVWTSVLTVSSVFILVTIMNHKRLKKALKMQKELEHK